MKKKTLVLIAAMLVLLAAGAILGLRWGSSPYSLRFDTVSRGDMTVYVTATGTLNPVTSVDVGTQVSGIVSRLYADFNSVVKKGDLIAQIDSTFLVQAVRDAEANVDKAQAQLNDSKRNYDREKALLERGLESQLNYDAALTSYETAQAGLKSAQSALDRARINLAYATIYAPIDGVVVNRAVNVGQTVAASLASPTLYTIANDLSKMQLLATVDESDIGRISIGQQAMFTVDAYPDKTFKGVVSQIRLDPQSIQNVVNYTVVINVNNDRLQLMPGMTANVKVKVAEANGVLRVPNMALRFQPPPALIDTTGAAGMGSSGGREGFRTRTQSETGEPGPTDSSASGTSIASARVYREGRMGVTAAHQADDSGFRRFGITPRFPEYEKSAYVPHHQDGRGRVWILTSDGKVAPAFIETGVSDGKYTEVHGDGLKEGQQIVTGATSREENAADQSRNVLAGGGQQGMMGGRFR